MLMRQRLYRARLYPFSRLFNFRSWSFRLLLRSPYPAPPEGFGKHDSEGHRRVKNPADGLFDLIAASAGTAAQSLTGDCSLVEPARRIEGDHVACDRIPSHYAERIETDVGCPDSA